MVPNSDLSVLEQAPIGYCLLRAIRHEMEKVDSPDISSPDSLSPDTSSPDGTSPADPAARTYDFQFLEVNTAFERMMDVPQAELIGQIGRAHV